MDPINSCGDGLSSQTSVTQAEHVRYKKEEVCSPNKTCFRVVAGTDGNLQEVSPQIPFPHSSTRANLNDHLLEVIDGGVVVLDLVPQVVVFGGALVDGDTKGSVEDWSSLVRMLIGRHKGTNMVR